MIVLDDFVMLGKTVPEPRSDGRIFVCSAGVSPTLKTLVRIYPLARASSPSRWTRSRIGLERNPSDSRDESFKIAGDRSREVHEAINARFDVVEDVPPRARAELLRAYSWPSIRYANEAERSLAIIFPRHIELTFRDVSDDDPDSPQLALFDDLAPVPKRERFRLMPRLLFSDDHGDHDLQLRDWGAYELIRKRGEDYARAHLRDALHLRDDSALLVGNQANRRTSWLVISVLNGVGVQEGLFDRMPGERTHIPAHVRRRIMARDSSRCQECGEPGAVIDHVWPVIRGGNNADDNLRVLCQRCNAVKSDRV